MSFFTRYSSFMCFNWYPSFGMECNWCHELCCIACVFRLAFRGSRFCFAASPRAPSVCAPFSVELLLWFFSVGIEPASRVEPFLPLSRGTSSFCLVFSIGMDPSASCVEPMCLCLEELAVFTNSWLFVISFAFLCVDSASIGIEP